MWQSDSIFSISGPHKNRFIWWWGKLLVSLGLYWHLMIKDYRIDIPHLECYTNEDLLNTGLRLKV